ncbi:hypothetical protein AB0L86_16135 [Micromonospora musae]
MPLPGVPGVDGVLRGYDEVRRLRKCSPLLAARVGASPLAGEG